MQEAVEDTTRNLIPEAFFGAAQDILPDDTSGFHGLLVQEMSTLSNVLAHVEGHMPPHSVHPCDARVWQVQSTSLRTELDTAHQDSADLASGFLAIGAELRAVQIARQEESLALEAEKLELRTSATMFESKRIALNTALDAKC